MPALFVYTSGMRGLVSLFLVGQLVFGCDIHLTMWMPDDDADPLFRFERNGKVGFIDATGRIVVQPKLPNDTTSSFHDGLLSLGTSSGPFVDTKGKRVIGDKLDRIWDFSEGLAPALKDFGASSPWGYVDRKGAWAISPRFPSSPRGTVSNFHEDLAAIETDGKTGYINHGGQFVVPQQFVEGSRFSEGAARIAVSGPCSYGDASPGSCRRTDDCSLDATSKFFDGRAALSLELHRQVGEPPVRYRFRRCSPVFL
jgi:hypothetical protein